MSSLTRRQRLLGVIQSAIVDEKNITEANELDSIDAVIVASVVEETLGVCIDRYVPTVGQTIDFIVEQLASREVPV